MKVAGVLLLLVCIGAVMAESEAEFTLEMSLYKANKDKICWKRTHLRGLGKIPDVCEAGEEFSSLQLCFPLCKDGYKGHGPTCTMSVIPPKTYLRSGKPGKCRPGMEIDTLLCYEACKPNYEGTSSLCIKKCPASHPFNCGAACATSATSCAKGIFKMVSSVAGVMLKVAAAIESEGASLLVNTLIDPQGLYVTFQLAKIFIQKGFTKKTFVEFMMVGATRADVKINQDTLMTIYEEASIVEKIRLPLNVASKLDPTGLSKVILAYMHEICQ